VLGPGGAQRHVDQPRAVAHQILDGLAGGEALAQQLGAAVEHLAKHPGRELAGAQAFGHGRQIGPVGAVIEELGVRAQEAAAAPPAAPLRRPG
jgi:hypothetical protein